MASKSKSRRRVLRASCLLAALIVAGSSFAWFTSKDEVTNRLSAAANYGVAIAEDFQPPENWVPGQSINKDAGAVNTGNVDAFTRMWLDGEMSVVARTPKTSAALVKNAAAADIEPVTDKKYTAIGLNYYNSSTGEYYRELSQTKIKNPDLNDAETDADEIGDNENSPATFSEVQSVQAGAYLVSVPTDAKYYYIVERATSIKAYEATDSDTLKNFELKEGDIVATKGATIPNTLTGKKVYIDNGTVPGDIDSSQFYPQTEGTYIFRRNVKLNTTANTADTYEYAGYYYVPKNGTVLLKTADENNEHYFALYTDNVGNSDYTLPTDAITTTTNADPSQNVTAVETDADKLAFFTAKETIVQNKNLKWTYTAADTENGTPAKLTAYYAGADGMLGQTRTGDGSTTPYAFDNGTSLDDIVIDVTLANIGTGSEEWTVKNGDTTPVPYYAPTATDATATATQLATNGLWTFYYNNDLEAGDTTTILVDSVKLSDATTQYAFLAFDFDLNVNLESVQVTYDEDGKEMATPVAHWAATEEGTPTAAVNTGANAGTPSYTGYEIDNVNWTTYSTT